jgi:hypothetical protein
MDIVGVMAAYMPVVHVCTAQSTEYVGVVLDISFCVIRLCYYFRVHVVWIIPIDLIKRNKYCRHCVRLLLLQTE